MQNYASHEFLLNIVPRIHYLSFTYTWSKIWRCRCMLVMSVVGLNVPTFLCTHVIWTQSVLDPLRAGQHVCWKKMANIFKDENAIFDIINMSEIDEKSCFI